MQFILPKHIKKCIACVKNAGYEAFCVGGAVRDMISGLKEPDDFDLAVSCPPEVTESLFPHTIPTGIKHGTVTVISDGIPVEVTTYRTDGGYTDSRHPDSVTFVGDIREDLARRDFTVNAIAYNDEQGVFDPFGGKDDLKNRILRTVGEPDRRFGEDALRIMRLYRFASQLDFNIEKETAESAVRNLTLLKNVSGERVFTELKKMLSGKALLSANEFFRSGGLAHFGIGKCDITPLCRLPVDYTVRLAGLIFISGADPETVSAALKSDTKTKKMLSSLQKAFLNGAPCDKAAVKIFLSRYGVGVFEKFLPLAEVFLNAKRETLNALFLEIERNDEPYTVDRLAIKGGDLLALGLKGEQVGEALDKLLSHVIEDPSKNTREELINLMREGSNTPRLTK